MEGSWGIYFVFCFHKGGGEAATSASPEKNLERKIHQSAYE